MPVKNNWERDHFAEPIILSNFKDIQGCAGVIRFVRKTVTIGRHVIISNTLSIYTCILTIVAKNPDRKLKLTHVGTYMYRYIVLTWRPKFKNVVKQTDLFANHKK